jgi:hypothetical protein
MKSTNHKPELENWDITSRFINKPIEEVEGLREFIFLVAKSLIQLTVRAVLALSLYVKTYQMKTFELISIPLSYLAVFYWISCIYQANNRPLSKPVLIGSLSPQGELELHVAALQYAQTLEKYRVVQSKLLPHLRCQLLLRQLFCCPIPCLHVLGLKHHH